MSMQKRIWVGIFFLISALGLAHAAPEEANEELNEESEPATQEQVEENLIEHRVAYLNPELKKQQALANSLKEHEVVWLDVTYPESSQSQKTLAIAHPSLIAEEQGAILFIHDKEQHADWPQIISPLRKLLPESGWSTLSISLPDDLRIQQPVRQRAAKSFDQIILNDDLKAVLDARQSTQKQAEPEAGDVAEDDDENTENVEKSDTESTDTESTDTEIPEETPDDAVDIDLAAEEEQNQAPISYDIRALSHIEKAVEHIKSNEPQHIVIVVHGRSSELVFQYIKAHLGELTEIAFSIVFVDPIVKESYILNIKDWLGESFGIPILEIINRGRYQASEHAKSRKLAMQKVGVADIKQLFLSTNNSQKFNEVLSQRIQVWLEK